MAVKVRSARHELYRRLVAGRASKEQPAAVLQEREVVVASLLDESVIHTLVPPCEAETSPILASVSGSKRLRETRHEERQHGEDDRGRLAPVLRHGNAERRRKLAFGDPETHGIEHVDTDKEGKPSRRPISWPDDRVEAHLGQHGSTSSHVHKPRVESSVDKSINSSSLSASSHISRRATMAASTRANKPEAPAAAKLPRSFSVAVSGPPKGTGRTREERAAMPGHACTCCTAFYDALGGQFDPHVLKDAASRHRAHCAPDATPPHYWDLDDDSLPAAADIPTHPRNNHFADSHKPQR